MNRGVTDYIQRKKRNKFVKKVIISSIFILAIFVAVVIKAPFFNIQKVIINTDGNMESEDIFKAKSIQGKNIFLIRSGQLEDTILSNQYIKNVDIKRKFPDEVVINVTERKSVFVVGEENTNYILNEKLRIMEEKSDGDIMSLTKIEGIDIEKRYVGEDISSDERRRAVLEKIGSQIINNDIKFTKVDITNLNKIILNYDKVIIYLGNDENIEEKITKVVDILKSQSINLESGYIDVSFNGSPVISQK